LVKEGFMESVASLDIWSNFKFVLFEVWNVIKEVGLVIWEMLKPLLIMFGWTGKNTDAWKVLGEGIAVVLHIVILFVGGIVLLIKKLVQLVRVITSVFSYIFSMGRVGGVGKAIDAFLGKNTSPIPIQRIDQAPAPTLSYMPGFAGSMAPAMERSYAVGTPASALPSLPPITVQALLEVDGKEMAATVRQHNEDNKADGGIRVVGKG